MNLKLMRPIVALLPLFTAAASAQAQPRRGDAQAEQDAQAQPRHRDPVSAGVLPSPDIPTDIDDDVLERVTKTPGGRLTIDLLARELRPVRGGLTPRAVADRAVRTDSRVKIKKAELRAAAARVDQAYAAYVPTVTAVASYTRLSRIVNSFDIGIDLPGGGYSFPVIVNQYVLSASLEVPISDYLLRTTQAFSAVSLEVETKELEVKAQELQTRADSKIAYFTWLRARGQRVVTRLALALSEHHLADAKIGMQAGVLSYADVARLEAQVAQSAHLVRMTGNFEEVAAEQLRTVMRLPEGAKLRNGVDVLSEPNRIRTPLRRLKRLALRQRLDRKALAKASTSLEQVESATRASHYPRLAGFANALYANPNPRIFPQEEKWDFTWDVGLRLTWTINDTFTTIGKTREVQAQRIVVNENQRLLEDAIRISVTSAYYELETAASAIDAAKQRNRSATISLAARRKLFRGGKATASEIIDMEVELTEARLQRLDAHIDYLVAVAKLELAVGGPVR